MWLHLHSALLLLMTYGRRRWESTSGQFALRTRRPIKPHSFVKCSISHTCLTQYFSDLFNAVFLSHLLDALFLRRAWRNISKTCCWETLWGSRVRQTQTPGCHMHTPGWYARTGVVGILWVVFQNFLSLFHKKNMHFQKHLRYYLIFSTECVGAALSQWWPGTTRRGHCK